MHLIERESPRWQRAPTPPRDLRNQATQFRPQLSDREFVQSSSIRVLSDIYALTSRRGGPLAARPSRCGVRQSSLNRREGA